MESIVTKVQNRKTLPIRMVQFGEGNFLRAFVDYWFDIANEKANWNGKCCVVQPIAHGLTDLINQQEGLYTLYLRGSQNGLDPLQIVDVELTHGVVALAGLLQHFGGID